MALLLGGTEANDVRGPLPVVAQVLRERREELMREWEAHVRLLSPARNLDRPHLRDDIPDLLEALAGRALAQRPLQASMGDFPAVHALERLDHGFELGEVVQEYAVLRRCLLRKLHEDGAEPGGVELINASLDEAIHEAVERYSTARNRTLGGLERISSAALEQLPPAELLPRLLQVLVETAPSVDTVAVLLLEDGKLVKRATIGLEADQQTGFAIDIDEGFAGRIARERQPVTLRFAASDPLVKSPAIRARGVRALYGVPLLHEHALIGVAHMGSMTAYEFTAADLLFFRAVCERVSGLLVQDALARRERAATEALRESDTRFKMALRNSRVVVFEQDRGLRYRWIYNPQLGYQTEEVIGRSDAELFDGPDLDRAIAIKRGVAETGTMVHAEITLGAGDRSPPRTYAMEIEAVVGPDGARDGIWGVATDVTERKLAEEELHRTAEFRDQFIGILGHDLRNPLNAIKASTHLLLKHGGINDAQVRAVRRIASSGDKMARMISDILDFARGRLGGGIPVERESTDLAELAGHAVEELHLANPSRQVDYEAKGDCHGHWDADRIAQVVGNLVGNALQHGAPDRPVRVRLRGEGEAVVLEVHNEGRGIPPALRGVIFEPFRGATGPTAGSGLGLGLYIVKQIVDAHHGRIDVESDAGAGIASGTTFRVTLPRDAPATPSPSSPE